MEGSARESKSSGVTVAVSRKGPILVAEIDNPPVNALSHSVRSGLLAAIDQLESDPGVDSLVIAARGRMFSGGADITEFGAAMRPPLLGEIVERLDAGSKPVVAAIHGSALGGGLELALACNARVAAPDASVGLPEVKLGILPGAGGGVRLPRLIGIAPALEMIAEGKSFGAAKALELGLIDEIAEGDLLAGACIIAGKLAAAGGTTRRASALPFPAFAAEAQIEARKALGRKFKGREAPQKAVELFAMAASTPFAEAARQEYAACKTLMSSSQSRALRYLFAAERMAAKPDSILAGAEPRDIRKVGVVGPGAMGRGIAIAFLDAGLPVTLIGRKDESLADARRSIGKSYESSLKRGAVTEAQAAGRVARLLTSTSLDRLRDADFVVETVTEDFDAKRQAIAEIDAVLSDSAIICTNSSFLPIDKLADATTRPHNFAGMHFFNPANIMKLVENVRTRAAAPDVLATLMALAKRLGKTPVLVAASEGFVANRMLSKRTREALFLLQDGATPAQVDNALTAFGFPIGPFALADMAGLDVLSATRATRARSMTERERQADIVETLVAAGRLGRKSGAGYYSYDGDGISDDPATAEMLTEHRRKRGIAPRAITDDEILERCLLALVNEGAKLVDEGAVSRASDIDVIWTAGLGFPAHLGGPMFLASEQGLRAVRDKLARYANLVGPEFFAPAPLISRLAESSATFQ